MKGSPAKMGSIQGTTGHASALKMAASPAKIGGLGGLILKGAMKKVSKKVGKITGKLSKIMPKGGAKDSKAPDTNVSVAPKTTEAVTDTPAKMYSSPAKKHGKKHATTNAEKRANLLKAVPNEDAYNKLSDTDKKGFDAAGKKAGFPQKKSPAKLHKKGKDDTKAKAIAHNKKIKNAKGYKGTPYEQYARKMKVKKREPLTAASDNTRVARGKPIKISKKTPSKWIGTAIKVVGKGLAGRAASQQARDDAKNKGVQQAMGRGSAVSKY